jgi:hypothetical protein
MVQKLKINVKPKNSVMLDLFSHAILRLNNSQVKILSLDETR